MNIAAAMTAIRLDLDGADKLALLVLAARAGRDVWTVTRSLPALAADMGVSERTARRAVAALRRKGLSTGIAHRGDNQHLSNGNPGQYDRGNPGQSDRGTPDNLSRDPGQYDRR